MTEQRNTLSDQQVFDAFPGVHIDYDNIAHYRGLLQQKLLINRCDKCGHWIYPHRPLCPHCLSWDVTPTPISGDGKVFMYTLIQQQRNPDEHLREPIAAAAIELSEQAGLRYLAHVVNCPVEKIKLDMPVKLIWVTHDDKTTPAFEPRHATHGKQV